MIITSRAARSQDIPFLTDCFLRSMYESITASRGQWDEARERAQLERQLNLEATNVIQVDEVDVGFVMLVPQPDALQLHTLCVAPEFQGRGIGSKVTVDVVKRGRDSGREVVLSVLKSNPRAEALYRRLGFKVVEESEHHRHLKHIGEASA